jgi:transcriptional regulator with XRE-family HTH domain
VDVATNTISRWETGTYEPTLDDLEKLSHAPGISILEFFPKVSRENNRRQKVDALMRAPEGLQKSDLDELRSWAEFRRARQMYKSRKSGQRSH